VLRVSESGIVRKAFLTLSQDKFTLYITTEKRGLISPGKGSIFSLRRTKSNGDADDTRERIIDIGAIDRIQRGQVTHKFELAKKSRQDSFRNLLKEQLKFDSATGARYSDLLFLHPNRSFSIIFRGERTLDLMTTDDLDRDTILDALDHVIRSYQAAKQRVGNDVLLLRYIWLDVDKDKKGTINAAELGNVLDRINFQMKKQELNATYEKFANIIRLDHAQRRKGLSFEQCCTFLHKLKRDSWLVKPVNILWNDLFGELMNNGKQRVSVSTKTFLENFIHKKQGEKDVTIQDVQRSFQRLHQMEIANVGDSGPTDFSRIDKDRFEAYLLSRENSAFDPALENFDKRRMTRPISEYWINSSHNTYLTGDQLTSHSSVEMYLNALYRGCRCLELDIWDSGEYDEGAQPIPVVWHGHTMTSKILFIDIIKALKIFLNFNPDSYPLILSFENHCSIPYQDVMAEQLIEVLGDSLYIPTEASLLGRLPSPEDMRGLIVIKGRRPDKSSENDDDFEYDSDEDDDDLDSEIQKNPLAKQTIAPQLARLTLFHGCKLKTWDTSLRNRTHYMHSFSENKVKTMCKQGKSRKWAIYNQSHMTRTYPAGSRVDSSNYSPMLAWSTGCQMVALNFQTSDAALKLNDGRFRENGGCGYVLKPPILLAKDDYSQSAIPVKLYIRILSGNCLPKPKGQRTGDCINPFVKVSVYDVKNEEKETMSTYQTQVSTQNGFFPIWSSEKFAFSVENGSVAILHIAVHDKESSVGGQGEFIASASIPVSCLRSGYRSVKLSDANNTRSGPFDFASLLIEVKKRKVEAEI